MKTKTIKRIDYYETKDLLAELDRLRQVNVELLVALKGVIRHIGPFMGQGRMDSEIAVARAAITAAKGE